MERNEATVDTSAAPPAAGSLPTAATRRFRALSLALGVGHLAVASLQGLRWEHVVADSILILFPWLTPRFFTFAKLALPLWITGVLIDSQRFLPLLGTIHTGDIRAFEIALFPAGAISWPEWFNTHTSPVLDFLCGLAYATYLVEFLGLQAFLYFTSEHRRFSALAWSFFAANLLGALIYVFFPVAPPWYVVAHGTGPADPVTAGNAAGCARFDAMLGIHYFSSFYSRNPNVFGAMPSLHVTYPTLVAWYFWDRGWRWRVFTLGFILWVSFSAVYLVHHYIVDVIAGALIAIPCCLWASAVTRRMARSPRVPAPPVQNSSGGLG